MLIADGLVKRYGKHIVVDHISFSLEKGKKYGLLGVNGAGKSSIMNMLAGYTYPTEGHISIGGYDLELEPQKAKKCLGYCPETPPLWPDMTVKEYLLFAAELKGLHGKAACEKIDNAMQKTSLYTVQKRLIRNLSKGYQQRVNIAQAILSTPRLLILDEPTAGLDPEQIVEIRNIIQELSYQSTILFSSHLLSEVSLLCDNIIVVSHGKLITIGTSEEIERQVVKEECIVLKAKCSLDISLALVTKIRLIQHIRQCDDSLHIYTNTCSEKVKECIFKIFANANIPILTLYTMKPGLEEIFLKLIDEEGK